MLRLIYGLFMVLAYIKSKCTLNKLFYFLRQYEYMIFDIEYIVGYFVKFAD